MSYLLNNPEVVLRLLWQHLWVSGSALAVSALLALPVGLLIAPRKRLAAAVLGIFGLLYTIPSLALIILLIPIFGLNARSVIVALVLYSQVILVRNLVAALQGVDPVMLEAARGMGMSPWQRWVRVQLPLALPVMLAGLRIAAVVTVAIATIGAKFGAGGLGTLLFDGIAQGRYDKIWAGAIAVAALALALNWGLIALERRFDPLRRQSRRDRAPAGGALPAERVG
jgi:osmoprotectant transport system permease protein